MSGSVRIDEAFGNHVALQNGCSEMSKANAILFNNFWGIFQLQIKLPQRVVGKTISLHAATLTGYVPYHQTLLNVHNAHISAWHECVFNGWITGSGQIYIVCATGDVNGGHIGIQGIWPYR